jgi:hypothetical protein
LHASPASQEATLPRIIPGTFGENIRTTNPCRHEATFLDALDALTPEQRETMIGLIRAFASAVRKPAKGANHRTRDLLTFVKSPTVLDWFTVNQLHDLAGHVAIAAYVRAAEAREQRKGGA